MSVQEPIERVPKYIVGQQFYVTRYQGQLKYVCTITDIHTTRDIAGNLVHFRYVATHLLCGQIITDSNVLETTVSKGVINNG